MEDILDQVDERPWDPPPLSDNSFREIARTLQSGNIESVSTASIQKAIERTDYIDEQDFSDSLFDALKEDLAQCGIRFREIEQIERANEKELYANDQWIILTDEHLQHEDYAIGFAQNVEVDRKLYNKSKLNSDDKMNPSPGHFCCIFGKDKDGKRQAEGIFSVVALKMNDTSSECSGLFILKYNVNKPTDPIIHEITYVFDHVWPSICRYGLKWSDTEMKSLKFAVVAAKRRPPDDASESSDDVSSDEESSSEHPEKSSDEEIAKHRWVRGHLEPPKTWGEEFLVQRHGYGSFSKDSSVVEAANVYLEIMLQGIQLAKKVIDILKEPSVVFPCPLAGLPPPGIEAEFCGSSSLSDTELKKFQPPTASEHVLNQDKGHEKGKKYCISQGDLYYVKKLDFSKALRIAWDEEDWLVEEPIVEDVFVKVWSRRIHRSLQDMSSYTMAYGRILLKGREKIVLPDLIGVANSSKTTITVMRAIHGDEVKLFNQEQPQNGEAYKSKLKLYWKLFQALCEDVLMPLAGIGIIHQDLRPGYNCTYNIMIGTTKADPNHKMRLIDYESLCRVIEFPYHNDERYPLKCGKVTAHNVLFQQCVGIAYAWIEQVDDENVKFSEALIWWARKVRPQSVAQSVADMDKISLPYLKKEEKVAWRQKTIAEIALNWWKENITQDKKMKEHFTDLFRTIDPHIEAATLKKIHEKPDEIGRTAVEQRAKREKTESKYGQTEEPNGVSKRSKKTGNR